MGQIAFVCAGQGDQHPGMGRDLARRSPGAAQVFHRCDRLRPGTSRQCWEGTVEELCRTANTQPCLFAVELAAAAFLAERGLRPDGLAGFSLGEVTAATLSGLFDEATGFRLVCRRGALMEAAAGAADTAMAAVVKLTAEQVTDLCQQFSQVYPVNFNCPGQVSVSGLREQMADFSAAVRAAGGRAIPLKVQGAFHSPFMAPAAEAFAAVLAETPQRPRTLPLYSNLTAQPYPDDAADLLARQISHPVRWEALIRAMIADGFDTFYELGPGRTLTGLIRKIDPAVTAVSVQDLIQEETV